MVLTKMAKSSWGITISAFLLNLASVIWACYLVNKTCYYNGHKHDFDGTIYTHIIITNIIASPILAAGILNIIGSAFVFHGLHAENLCSLVWYIVLNSVAICTQTLIGVGGIVMGSRFYRKTYTSASGMNPISLCYLTVVVIAFNLASTVMIGKQRNKTRNKKIAALFAAGSPQVVMVPGATANVFTQQTNGQYQNQYPQQFPTQQYYMPQQVQQQGNAPAYATASGPDQ